MDDFLKKLISEALATGKELDEANNKGGNKMVKEYEVLEAVKNATENNKVESVSTVLEEVFASFENKGATIDEGLKSLLRESAKEAEAIDVRDASEFKAALLAGRVIESALQGKNVISNIIGDGVNIEISATVDETLKQPTEYFYESNQKDIGKDGIEVLAALCHDLKNSGFTYYTKDDVPAPVKRKADALLAERIAIMARDLTLEFIKGHDNASCKQELVIRPEGKIESDVRLCITMSNEEYMSTTALMSGIQSIGIEELIELESELGGN